MRHLRVDVLSSHWPRRWPGWTSVKRRSNRSEVHRPLVDVDLEQENSIKNLPMAHRPDLKLQKKICDMIHEPLYHLKQQSHRSDT